MDVNRLHAAVLFLGTELNPWNFASAWKKDRYGKRFNRNLTNVGGREGRNSRYARFSVRSCAEFFISTRGQHAAVHRRSDFACPLEIIVETHRGNEGSLFHARAIYVCGYTRTRRGVDLLRVAGRGERIGKEKKGQP